MACLSGNTALREIRFVQHATLQNSLIFFLSVAFFLFLEGNVLFVFFAVQIIVLTECRIYRGIPSRGKFMFVCSFWSVACLQELTSSLFETYITDGPELEMLAAWLATNPALTVLG